MSPTPSEPLSAGFSSDSLLIASRYFSAALPVNGDLVGGLPIVASLQPLTVRSDALQVGRLDQFAILAEHNLSINQSMDLRGDLGNPLDDARAYAGNSLQINPPFDPLMSVRDFAIGPSGHFVGGLTAGDTLVRLDQPIKVELPTFEELKSGALAGGFGPESVVDMSRTWLNSVADVTKVLRSGTPLDSVVFRVVNGGLNLPDGSSLSHMTIFVDSGDFNANGVVYFNDVRLITKNGTVNLGGVNAQNLSVFSSGAIHMNQEARFSGENLLTTEKGSIIFNGATETIGPKDHVKVVAHGGDLILNAAADTRGDFLTTGSVFVNQDSTVIGAIWAKQDVTLNAHLTIIRDILLDADFPIENQPMIVMIDTGAAGNNPDIDYSRITPLWDWVGGDSNPFLEPGEGNEHGTHTLGEFAAISGNNLGIDGINGKAPIYLSRATGSGLWTKAIVEAIDRFEAESKQPNLLIYLGFDLTQRNASGEVSTRYALTLEERLILEYARQKGALIVVPAGNDGGVMSALGQAAQEFDNIVAVGSIDALGLRSSYSSYGAGLTIVAPGGSIDQPRISTVGDGLGTMAGTSVAAAHEAGEISLIWAANPGLSYQQVIRIVKESTIDVGAPGWDEETAFGMLDVKAAVELAKKTTPERYDPPATILPDTWSGAGIVLPLERAANWTTNFQAWVVPTSGANVRQSPNTQSPIVGIRPYGTNVQFTRWTYGQRVNDMATGQPDERWYYDAAMGGWIASAIVGGNAPGSTPLPPVVQPTPGPTPTPVPGPVVTPSVSANDHPAARPGQQREYRVRAGDTLSAIALRELGNANRWREIQKADGSTFTDLDSRLLTVGSSIYLPVRYQSAIMSYYSSSMLALITFYRAASEILNLVNSIPSQNGDRLNYSRFDQTVRYMLNEMKNNVKSSVANDIKQSLSDSRAAYDSLISLEIGYSYLYDGSQILGSEFQSWINLFYESQRYTAIYEQKQAYAKLLWANQVKENSDWDHKPKLANMLSLKGLNKVRDDQQWWWHIPSLRQAWSDDDFYFPLRGDTQHEYYYDIWSNIHYGYVGTSLGFDRKTLQDAANSGWPGAGTNDQSDIVSTDIGINLWNKYGLSITEDIITQSILDKKDELNRTDQITNGK
jgi:hypothetical protein